MNTPKDNQTVYELLLQLMFQGKRLRHQLAEELGLPFMQSSALTMLSADEPQAMRVLSDYFMCDASTVTGLADRLEARGLIERHNHPTDRRVKLIKLTPEGAKLKDELAARSLAVESERLDQILSAAERETLRDLLRRLLKDPVE